MLSWRLVSGWGIHNAAHAAQNPGRRNRESREGRIQRRERHPNVREKATPMEIEHPRQPHIERTKKDRNDIEVGKVSQNLYGWRELERKEIRMEMILTGSSIESSLYFVAGGPRSGCTMPVMNDLSHGPRQNLAELGKSTRLRKRELG